MLAQLLAPRIRSSLEYVSLGVTCAKEVEECAKEFEEDIEQELSSEEVHRQQQKWGWNEMEKHKRLSVWKLIMDKFKDTLEIFYSW